MKLRAAIIGVLSVAFFFDVRAQTAPSSVEFLDVVSAYSSYGTAVNSTNSFSSDKSSFTDYSLDEGTGTIGYAGFTSPNPEVEAYTSVGAQNGSDLAAYGTVDSFLQAQYSFIVVGPPSSARVPIDVAVNMTSVVSDPHASSTIGAFSIAVTYFGTSVGGGASDRMSCAGSCDGTEVTASSEYDDVTVLETAGVPDTITIQALTESQFGDGGMTSASATVDPYIFIDPSFANASQYSIEVGPGVGNFPDIVPAVPEPSTYAAMLVGIGCIGLRMRRRKPA